MKLTNGADTVILTDEIQIRAYISSGYIEVPEKSAKKRGTENGHAKSK